MSDKSMIVCFLAFVLVFFVIYEFSGQIILGKCNQSTLWRSAFSLELSAYTMRYTCTKTFKFSLFRNGWRYSWGLVYQTPGPIQMLINQANLGMANLLGVSSTPVVDLIGLLMLTKFIHNIWCMIRLARVE